MTIMTMIVHQIRNNMEHPKISKNTLNDVGISMGFPCENRLKSHQRVDVPTLDGLLEPGSRRELFLLLATQSSHLYS